MEKVRIDKWLWAVRIFKTRTMAADYCEKGKVFINDQVVKASRLLKKGETISIRKGAFTLQFLVIDLSDKRMSAKLVPDFCKEVTPVEEIERMKTFAMAARSYRFPGEGRPTKKERRALDDFLEWE
ncbi:MAG TPA: S4 domain-containing protein [Bacteroidia bacterium]|nr:S4 domain-containing protein [Bacteroidia bacterium]